MKPNGLNLGNKSPLKLNPRGRIPDFWNKFFHKKLNIN
jgi:hypothetical protein